MPFPTGFGGKAPLITAAPGTAREHPAARLGGSGIRPAGNRG